MNIYDTSCKSIQTQCQIVGTYTSLQLWFDHSTLQFWYVRTSKWLLQKPMPLLKGLTAEFADLHLCCHGTLLSHHCTFFVSCSVNQEAESTPQYRKNNRKHGRIFSFGLTSVQYCACNFTSLTSRLRHVDHVETKATPLKRLRTVNAVNASKPSIWFSKSVEIKTW